MSFQDVKAIYDSLPEDQKRLVSPRGEFVDSPRLAIRTVTPEKDGYAEAYNMPGNKAFVTLAEWLAHKVMEKKSSINMQALAAAVRHTH